MKRKRLSKKQEQAKIQKQLEDQYFAVETAKFRVRHPKVFRESKDRAGIAKILLEPLKQWRESRKDAVAKWAALENYLLSGKMRPKTLYTMLNSAQNASKKTLEFEELFLKNRAVARSMILNEKDWNALERVWAMEDSKAKVDVERLFYGQMKRFGETKTLVKFAELIVRMNAGNDKSYKRLKESIASIGVGIENRGKKDELHLKKIRKLGREGKISAKEVLRENLLVQYMHAFQYFTITEASQKLYRRLGRFTKDPKLKTLLVRLEREMKRRKLMYMSERTRIEYEFNRKDSKL